MTATLEPIPGEHVPTRRFTTRPGHPHPLGATPDANGTNFAVFSQHATSVTLLIFDAHDSPRPIKVIELDPDINRTFYFWHIYVVGVTSGMGYAYRVDGPKDVHGAGHRFNPNKVLIDPYAPGHDVHPVGSGRGVRPGRQRRALAAAASSST